MSWSGVTIGLLVATLFAVRFAPRMVGWLRRWQALRRRAIFEDALKHLLACKHGSQSASIESLAGALHLSPGRVVDLVTRMEGEGLVASAGSRLQLTTGGERWALRVVRAHRLWERYLADEAGMPLADLHRAAERAEHRLSAEDADLLDAHLGYPRRDPHGDPIPNASGEVEPLRATSLTDWAIDEAARIVHIEDEPAVIFKQIVAQGLRPGQIVRILDASPERLILSDGNDEYRLSPLAAASIQVAALPATREEMSPDLVRLCELPRDQHAEVVMIDDACRGLTRRRLLDLGLTRGARVHPELDSVFGEPRAFAVRGTLITLRREQAALVWVRPNDDGEPARLSA
jgi:DtxR family Mn-dependent transcriptional regulator